MVATLISLLLRISLFFCITAHAAGTTGLNYQTYAAGGATPTYTQDANGNITNRTLVSTGTVSTINYNWGGGAILNSNRADGTIVRFYGYINIAASGTYNFGGNADDGIRIKVNNTSVVNSWREDGGTFRSGSIYLTAGIYAIELMYYENGGGALVNLQWYLNNSWQIVDSTYIATDSTYFTPATPTYSSGITTAQQTRKTSETTQRLNQSGNEIQIEQIGDNNNITIRQGVTISGKNRIELYSNGNYNTLNLNQGYTTSGTVSSNDSNNHYLNLNLIGNNNTVTKQQTGTNNFLETTISGNSNNVTNIQQGTSGKILFQNVSGNNNTVTTNQKDSGQHYLDIKLTGNGHNVGVTQQGTGNHAATIDFTNSGGASSLNLNQSGSVNQIYSIQQSCVNAAGCSTTITQP
ncbi:hypothetical protein EB001_04620 [bacterium]|nr:hypothetical protein [bacterium]